MKAFASDFDGTLYFMSQEEKMRLCDLQAIREFQEKGNLFGVSTGRSLRGITDVVQEISFDFYILASGAYVLDRDFQVIFKKCIPFDTMKIIYERYEKDVLIIIQANDSVYAMQAKRPLQVYIESLEEMKGSDIYGLSFGTRSPEEARAIAEELNQCYGDTIIAYANVQNVDIVGKDCSKGRALSLVKEYYGVDIMAGIGDSYNDIPMLMESDQAYTFSYAPLEVQKMADCVVENVAQAISDFQKLETMKSFPEKNCSQLAKKPAGWQEDFNCPLHENLSDQELWERIDSYEKKENLGMKIIMASGILMGVGMMFGVATGKLVVGLPFMAIGVVMTLFGGRLANRSNRYKNALITDQIGPYAKEQYEEMMGPFDLSFELEDFRETIEDSRLLPAWNTFEGGYYIKGQFEGMDYLAGNVALTYKQRGMNHGEDLDQDTYRFPVLQGIWFHCDRKHELDAPLYIRENGTEEKARFKNVLADQSWGQDAFSHKILTGKASFDEQYAVYCEDEEGALKVLDGEMLRTIEEIRRNSEGKIQIEFQKDFTNIAIQTPFLIYSHLIGQKTGNVREIKQGFLVNLHYQFHLMQEIKRL